MRVETYSSSSEWAVVIDTSPVDITSECGCIESVSGERTPASVAASLRRKTGAAFLSIVDVVVVVVGLVRALSSELTRSFNLASSLSTSLSTVLSNRPSLTYH